MIPKSRPRLLRFAFAFAAIVPLTAHIACSAGNGDPIPDPIYDASPLVPGVDRVVPDSSTPDDASPDVAPKDGGVDAPPDAPPNTAPVQINEVYVDNAFLRGDATEYVELRAAAGTPVDDLKLRILYGDGTVKYVVSVGDPGQKFGSSGLWVVGGGQTFKLNVTDKVDHVLSTTLFGLDDHGAVQLVRGSTLLDVVGYGDNPDAGPLPAPLSPPLATAEGRVARTAMQPGTSALPARSIGRKNGAPDTNDNGADFCAMVASPGFAQKACE